MTSRFGWLLFATLGASGAAFAATTIFGVAYSRATSGVASLYTISPATGAATLVGVTGFHQLSAIAFAPNGTLYGIGRTAVGNTQVLLTINTTTGAATQVALVTGAAGNLSDMDFRPSDGVLFARVGPDGGQQVYTVNTTTGVATLVGNDQLSGADGGAMAFSSANVLYGASESTLHTINQSTGVGTLVVNLTYSSSFGPTVARASAMKFDSSGTLYASVTVGSGASVTPQLSSLGTINTSTGAVTRVGATTTGMDAIAITGTAQTTPPPPPPPVTTPAPSSLLLLLTGMLGIAGWMGRRWVLHLR